MNSGLPPRRSPSERPDEARENGSVAEDMGRNPALIGLDFLAGEWDMALSNAPFLPSPTKLFTGKRVVNGSRTVPSWSCARPCNRKAHPRGRWTIGRDEEDSDYTVLYADTRGVSRVYNMRLTDGLLTLWRNNPGFSQRFEGHVSDDRNSIAAHWGNPSTVTRGSTTSTSRTPGSTRCVQPHWIRSTLREGALASNRRSDRSS